MEIGDRVRIRDGREGLIVSIQDDQFAVRYDGGDDEGMMSVKWNP